MERTRRPIRRGVNTAINKLEGLVEDEEDCQEIRIALEQLQQKLTKLKEQDKVIERNSNNYWLKRMSK